jgi:hypothetical protein
MVAVVDPAITSPAATDTYMGADDDSIVAMIL